MHHAWPERHRQNLIVIGTAEEGREVLVLLEVAVKQHQLLLAVGRVIDSVQVQGQLGRGRGKGSDKLVDQDIAQPLQGGNVDGVLEAGQGGLAGQVGVRGGAIGEEFEDGIGAEDVMVVLVFITGQNAVQTGAHHAEEGMLNQLGVAPIVQGGGELGGEADAFIELAPRQQAGITGKLCGRGLDHQG